MKFSTPLLFRSAAAALFLALALPAAVLAQATPPPAKDDPAPSGGLRRLDLPAAAATDPDADQDAPPPPKRKPGLNFKIHGEGNGGDRVTTFADNHIFSDDHIHGAAVAVMGSVTVDGEVEDDAVAVLGNNTVNGHVHGQVVAVLGNITLGPKAVVDGQVVCVGGRIDRDPGAFVGGQIVQQAFGSGLHSAGPAFDAWFHHGLRWGRPLAWGPHLGWLWTFMAVMFGIYVLLALVFPGGLRRCGDALVHRPGLTILSAVLSIIAIPVLFVLLLISVVGIPVAFLLPVGIVVAVAFGKASLYSLVGRRVSHDRLHPALAVLLGGAICVLLYLVPFVGLLLSMVFSGLALGCVVTALFASSRSGPAKPAAFDPFAIPNPVVSPAPSPLATAGPIPVGADPEPLVPLSATAEPAAPPFIPAAPPLAAAALPPVALVGLPRAGFWIRAAALLIDVILVGLIVSFLPHLMEARTSAGVGFSTHHAMLLLLPAYAVVLWKLKGSTIGGIVCRLQVVRLDGRPIDWTTAIVRGLGSYLSFVCVGLGFLWVAFDPQRQSWHDKIAGTTVVRPPSGISLI
jgi:uncharacterized RDD family membrane protein YckC